MPDASVPRKPGPGRVARGRQQVLEVERIGRHADRAVGAAPARGRVIGVDLDAVAFRVRQVERRADAGVGRAVQRDAVGAGEREPAPEFGAVGQQEGDVEQAGLTPVAGAQGRVADELQQRRRNGAQQHRAFALLQHRQPDDVTVEAGNGRQVPHPEPDAADPHRCRAHVEGIVAVAHGKAPGRGVWPQA